jgi:hypothetical protein
MGTYYFIKSKLDGNVIDIQDIKGDDTTSGALLDAYPQKTTGTDNQLWSVVGGEFPSPVSAVPAPRLGPWQQIQLHSVHLRFTLRIS